MNNGFLESRTAWRELKARLLLEPLPGGSRWAAAFGSLLLFSFLVQVVTGVLLSMDYAPSVDSAWSSVNYIMSDVRFGSLVRSMHHWGSSAMVVLLLAHLVQVFIWGAYKRPREFTWMAGVALLMLTLALAFTGYLLPWDQKAYWATKVGLGIVSTVPGIGEGLKTSLQGGPQMGNLTLTRFFAIHAFVLPGLLIALVVVHLYLFRLHGVTPPWWESESQLEAEKEPFWPGQALKDAVCALVFLAILVAWAHFRPAPLEARADPSQPYEARPEWYFMFLFYLLQFFKGPYEVVGTFVLPTLFVLVLFFWPFLDRNPVRDPRRRRVAMGLLTGGSCGLVGLTVFAIATDVRMREPQAAMASSPLQSSAGRLQQIDVAGLFATNCVACHGVDGKGEAVRPGMPNIPDFTSLSWQLGHTDVHLVQGIVDGKPPQMPSYRDKLRPEEATALAVYVRAFVTPLHPEVLTAPTGAPTTIATPAPAPSPPVTDLTPLVTSPVQPAELYATFCFACHDRDGSGRLVKAAMPKIPDLTDTAWRQEITEAKIVQAILEGREPFMRPFRGKLSEPEALALAKYIREFPAAPAVVASTSNAADSGSAAPPLPGATAAAPPLATVPSVRTETSERIALATNQYRRYCLACHGTDGRGTAVRAGMPTIPDLTNQQWQSSRSDAQLTVNILEGYGKLMPPFRDHLTRPQAQALAAYVRTFSPQLARAEAPVATGDLEERMRQLQEQWQELERQIKGLNP